MALADQDMRAAIAVTRFGLEDEQLNQQSLKLLARMRVLEEDIARLTPEDQAAVVAWLRTL